MNNYDHFITELAYEHSYFAFLAQWDPERLVEIIENYRDWRKIKNTPNTPDNTPDPGYFFLFIFQYPTLYLPPTPNFSGMGI